MPRLWVPPGGAAQERQPVGVSLPHPCFSPLQKQRRRYPRVRIFLKNQKVWQPWACIPAQPLEAESRLRPSDQSGGRVGAVPTKVLLAVHFLFCGGRAAAVDTNTPLASGLPSPSPLSHTRRVTQRQGLYPLCWAAAPQPPGAQLTRASHRGRFGKIRPPRAEAQRPIGNI